MPVPDLNKPADPAELRELLGYVNTCWDDERRALARQMHDSLGSSLTALTMHLGLLTAKLPQDPALLERAAQMKNVLHTVIETNRAMQHKLWNDKLEFLGIKVALAELVAQFGAEHAVVAKCSMPDEEPACPHGHALALLHALEEGLRNVAAHARASLVEVVVDDNDDAIMLTLKDNGDGFPDEDSDCAGKHGLRVVRERAAYLGGTFTIGSNGARGTVLTLTLPKKQPSAA